MQHVEIVSLKILLIGAYADYRHAWQRGQVPPPPGPSEYTRRHQVRSGVNNTRAGNFQSE